MNALLEAALRQASAGNPILPLCWTDRQGFAQCPQGKACSSPGKHPLTKNGLDDATTDPKAITDWWRRWPQANVGARTDSIARIDIDLPDVAEVLARDVGLQLETEMVRTPRPGLHIGIETIAPVASRTLYLEDGRRLGELKAARAYVVIPPSAVAGKPYVLVSPEGVEPIRVKDPLGWLREQLPSFGFALADYSDREPDYKRLGGTIYEGEGRHDALVSYGGRIWVEGMGVEGFLGALQAVNKAQCRPPLPDEELEDIARHFIERREQGSNGHRPVEMASVGEEPSDKVFDVGSLDDWLGAEEPEMDVVIGDGGEGAVLTLDGKGFVAGPTGVGKTNLLLRMERGMAEGSSFLGLPIPQPRRVLHLALEGSRRGLKRRLAKVWDGAGPEARGRFFMSRLQLDLAEEDDIEALRDLLRRVRPEVLVIDPLRNAHPWDENSSQEMARLTALLDRISAEHGCAIILAHHDRKRPPLTRKDGGIDKVRGSTALTGWLSFCLSFEPDGRQKDVLVAEWTKLRDAEEPLAPLTLVFDRARLDFVVDDQASLGRLSDEAVLDAVSEADGGVRGSELITALMEGNGVGERTVRDKVRGLVKQGRLVEFVADEDRRSKAKSYRLA